MKQTPASALQASILQAFGYRRHDLLIWRANTGAVRFPGAVRDRFVRFGVKGGSDLMGVLAPSGRFLAMEIKAERDKLTPEQWAFLADVNAHGGYGVEVRSLTEALAHFDRARAGLAAPVVVVV